MKAIWLNELRRFFGSLTGYIAMAVFLVAMGLFVWVFPETNVPNSGFASLDTFFGLAPFILVFLVPALTMRSFAEEYSTGTIELLGTKPIGRGQIVAGKYAGALTLVFLTLLPSFIYLFSVSSLAMPAGNVDWGAMLGSYAGLFLLAATFAALGLFSSAITKNTVIAFLAGVFLCFFLYIAFDYLAKLGLFYGRLDYMVERLGMESHYQSISRGVIDTRDVVYFFGVILFFLMLTVQRLNQSIS